MELGAIFPTSEIGNDPVVIRDFAQAAEDLGYAHIMTYDHVVSGPHERREPPLNGPYTEIDPFHEPIALLAYFAAITKRILLGTGILILPQRQAVLVAKQMAQLAILSGDRVFLGVGTGWNHIEYEALGTDFKQRGAVLDEQIEVLRKLWSEPLVDFTGKYHRIDRAGILPLPNRPIPIWMGGFGHRPVDRAVQLGDGYIFGAGDNAEGLAAYAIEQLRKHGRDPASFVMDYAVKYSDGPEAWHRSAKAWSDLGARYLSVRTMGPPGLANPGPRLPTPRAHIEALETFMNEMKQYRSGQAQDGKR
jgi:probable F420-dependent oxidoreductase